MLNSKNGVYANSEPMDRVEHRQAWNAWTVEQTENLQLKQHFKIKKS